MISEPTANTIWYNLERTLVNLNLIDQGVSIVPDHLAIYVTTYCPNLLPWEYGTTDEPEDTDQDNLDALHHLELAEIEIKFYQTVMELFR